MPDATVQSDTALPPPRRPPVAVAVGGSPAETATRVAGGVLALVGAFLIWQALQSVPAQPAGAPGPTATPTPSATATPTDAAAPTPTPTATATPPTEQPVTGSALGIASYTPTGGDCPNLSEFNAGFEFGALDGALTLTQLGINHISTGTIENGVYEVAGPGQVTEGVVTGTSFSGTATDTTGGCTGIYAFDGDLTRPFTAGPPFADVPGYFEVLAQGSGLGGLGLPEPGQSVHLIVASEQTDVTAQLPIRVVGTSGNDTFWDFVIDGDPAVVCRGPTGCSADAPTPVDAAWANAQPLIVATGGGGDRIAVMAPQGLPTTVLPTPTPSPTAASTATPTATSAAAAPTATATEAEPTPRPGLSTGPTTDDGPNVPLALAGTALLVGGGGLAFAAPAIVGVVTRRREPVATRSVEQTAATYIAEDVAATPLVGRAYKDATLDPGSGIPIGLIAAAAAVLLVALLGGLAVATGFFEAGGTAVASPTASVQDTATPAPPSPTAEPTPEPEPVTGVLTELGLWDPAAILVADTDGGNYSIPGVAAGNFPPYVDVIGSGSAIVEAAEPVVTEAFNASVFDCDEPVDGVLTVCASGADMPAGPLLVAVAQMDDVVPQASDDGLLTYALALRADTDPANDYVAEAPFTDDFYQGTDRWYELTYTEGAWTLSVDRGEMASNARAAIRDDAILFFVPMSEIGVELPPFRLTAFVSGDASFAAETSGGDVAPGPPTGEWTVAEPYLAPAAAGRLFLERFVVAVRTGDEAFLFDRLHPAVIERYGDATCRAYAATFEEATFELTPIEVAPPAPWDYVTDERATMIDDAWAVLGSTIVDGALAEREFHFAPSGATVRWFTDCGEPVP